MKSQQLSSRVSAGGVSPLPLGRGGFKGPSLVPFVSNLLGAAVLLGVCQAHAQSPEPAADTASTGGQPVAVAPLSPVPEAAPGTKWQTTLYGFAEADAMHDTSQSYGPASNNTILARPGSYAGAHGRTQLTVANSQVGLRFAAPDFGRIKTSGRAEVDFFGVQPTDATENTMFTTPSIRMRLFYFKVKTPIADVLIGQYHELFAWGGEGFYQNSLAFLGVGGEVYHRNPQIRLSKTFGGDSAVNVDLAVAAVRPVQRDAEVPDLQAGIKLAVNAWKGATAQGFGQPTVMPLAIGVSGVGRRFAVAEFLTNPGDAKVAYGWGAAANAFLPLLPTRSETDRSNALSLTVEASVGSGISDLYTGLTGGAMFPLLPDPSGNLVPPPVYRPNIDSGIVTFDANGNLKSIDWRALLLGLQYYLPVAGGRIWVSATASRLESPNILSLTPEASRGGIFIRQDYVDGNLFAAVTPELQVGLSYQLTRQPFGDRPFNETNPHPEGKNQRVEIGFRVFF
jgi:hypothetical protein